MRALALAALLFASAMSEAYADEYAHHLAILKEFVSIPAQTRARQDIDNGIQRYLSYNHHTREQNEAKFQICAPSFGYEVIEAPSICATFTEEEGTLRGKMYEYTASYNKAVMEAAIESGRSQCSATEQWNEFDEWLSSYANSQGFQASINTNLGPMILLRESETPAKISSAADEGGEICASLASHGITRTITIANMRSDMDEITSNTSTQPGATSKWVVACEDGQATRTR